MSTTSIRNSCIEGGFTLIEVLVSVAIASVVLAASSTLLAASRNFIQTQMLRVETVQALRATLDTMARDLRLGGACLPTTGDFSPLDGTSNGTTDTVTTRTGLVRPNLTCINPTLTSNAAAGATSLVVQSSDGFAVGMRALIYNGSSGQSFTVASISGNTLGTSAGMSQAYTTATATVYAIDERTYSIDTSDSTLPVLKVAINGATAQPFAAGIEALNIQYRLNRNCPPCDTIDPPTASSSDWQLVNEIVVNVTARSRKTDLTGTYFRRSVQFIAKPRNLIPTG